MKHTYLSLIEQAYRLDQDARAWHDSIAEHAANVFPGDTGAMAYSFDATNPENGVRVDAWGASRVPDSFVEATLRLNETTRPEDAARFYHRGILCATVSEMIEKAGGSALTNRTYNTSVGERGFSDTFGLTASDPTHRGLVVNSPLPHATTLNARVKLAWQQVGVHLHVAYRLRTSLQAMAMDPEAVVDPDGSVLHCETESKDPRLREPLRHAARAIDAARARGGPSEPTEALEMWQGLVSGRWTLIETFESDGRRLFLAYPNEIDLANPRALTPRERAVVGYVVQGDSNKWIAYQLGIRPATVARHLSVALRKLGLGHRHELIWLYHALHTRNSSSKSQ